MSSRPRPASRPRPPIAVTVELDPVVVSLLDVSAGHLGKSRAETVAEALRCLFIHLPRPDDRAPPTLRDRLHAAVDLAFTNKRVGELLSSDVLDGAELAALDRTLAKLLAALHVTIRTPPPKGNPT